MKRILFILLIVLGPTAAYADDYCLVHNGGTFADQTSWGLVGPTINGVHFTVPDDCVLSTASFLLAKNGTPADNAVIELYDDSSGVPGSLLATGSTVSGASISGTSYANASWATSTFSYTLTAGTNYWLRFTRSGAADNSNYYITPYRIAAANVKHYNGTVWGSYEGDTTLTLYGASSTSPTPPDLGGATSTVDQSQQNLANAVYIYLACFALMVWLMRKH